MSFCLEMKEEFDEKKAKKLIELVDWITDEHFAKKSILHQVGWCANQLLQKRILNYKKGEELVKSVYLVEFSDLIRLLFVLEKKKLRLL